MTTIKKIIFDYLEEHPKTSRKGLKKQFGKYYSHSTLANYRCNWINQQKSSKLLREGLEVLLNVMKTKMTPRRELNKKERAIIIKLEALLRE